MNLIKPPLLKKGDTVATICQSWGGASSVPSRYEIAKRQVKDTFGLTVIEAPNTLQSAEWIYNHPKKRLDDLMWCLQNPDVKGIISVIGGDDSIRLLDFVTDEHLRIIRENPKPFVGLSDSTTINYLFLKAGVASFYGPSMLFGLAENGGIDAHTAKYFHNALFEGSLGEITSCQEGWILDRVPWGEKDNHVRRRQPPMEIQFLQGSGVVSGPLIGGCADVLEFMKGTRLWPDISMFDGAILFLETSEDEPSADTVMYWLRNYGAQGILQRLNGIVFGIPGGQVPFDSPTYYVDVEKHVASFSLYDDVLMKVCAEYKVTCPIVTRMHFGHTMPFVTLPFGAKMTIDCDEKKVFVE